MHLLLLNSLPKPRKLTWRSQMKYFRTITCCRRMGKKLCYHLLTNSSEAGAACRVEEAAVLFCAAALMVQATPHNFFYPSAANSSIVPASAMVNLPAIGGQMNLHHSGGYPDTICLPRRPSHRQPLNYMIAHYLGSRAYGDTQ